MVPQINDKIVHKILFGKNVVQKNRHELPPERHAHFVRVARELLDELAVNLGAMAGRRTGFVEDFENLEGELEAVHVVSTHGKERL